MKFSVLLPTRNRLELLKYALASILQQDESDLEVIISDNNSEEDIAGFIKTLNDHRIKYYRTDSFVSVTENWNNALNKATGDWVIMLGDDDCLMKGYFTEMRNILDQFPNPDFIYTHGFLFAYPNTLPEHPDGYARTASNAKFVIGSMPPYWLDTKESYKIAKDSFNFKCTCTYNMQFALINRDFIEKLKIKGNFYHPPYPDYYAMAILMLFGKSIVACPHPLVAVGITKKSWGYFHFNNLEAEGIEFLNNSQEKTIPLNLQNIILPGTDFNTSWLLTLDKIKKNFSDCPFEINLKKYRLTQIIAYFRASIRNPRSSTDRREKLWKQLSVFETCVYGWPWYILSYFPLIFRRVYVGVLSRIYKTHVPYPVKHFEERFDNMQQFFEKIDPLNCTHQIHD